MAVGEAREHGRAGRNLGAAIAIGVGLFVVLVITLWRFPIGFVVLMAAALTLGTLEVAQALRKSDVRVAVVPIAVGTVVIILGSYFAGLQHNINSNTVMLGLLGATVLASLIVRMPGGADGFVRDVSGSLFIIGWVPLLASFVSLMLAAGDGWLRVIAFLVVITLADTSGYAVGVVFGRHPMAPQISPKKSWEGFAGSLVFGTGGGVLVLWWFFDQPWWVGAIFGVALVLAAACGDLVESLVKRDLGIKDMSSFLPGHGGVMDRLDSLLLAAPLAWIILEVFLA